MLFALFLYSVMISSLTYKVLNIHIKYKVSSIKNNVMALAWHPNLLGYLSKQIGFINRKETKKESIKWIKLDAWIRTLETVCNKDRTFLFLYFLKKFIILFSNDALNWSEIIT